MTIKVVKETSDHEKETWEFTVIDFDLVFTEWRKEERYEGKRTWLQTARWGRHFERTNTTNEPELTREIRTQAMEKAFELIKVKTWNEFKKIPA